MLFSSTFIGGRGGVRGGVLNLATGQEEEAAFDEEGRAPLSMLPEYSYPMLLVFDFFDILPLHVCYDCLLD